MTTYMIQSHQYTGFFPNFRHDFVFASSNHLAGDLSMCLGVQSKVNSGEATTSQAMRCYSISTDLLGRGQHVLTLVEDIRFTL
jgi:hypothetical protein